MVGKFSRRKGLRYTSSVGLRKEEVLREALMHMRARGKSKVQGS